MLPDTLEKLSFSIFRVKCLRVTLVLISMALWEILVVLLFVPPVRNTSLHEKGMCL
jgi:hypothetical protein